MFDFFNKLLSSRGYPIAVYLDEKGFMHNRPCQDITGLVEATINLDKFHETYFALATYKEFRYNKSRTTDNILYFKSAWMDIDIAKDRDDRYTTLATAIKELTSLIKQVGLPKPMLVKSGTGLHVYWPFITEITYEQWFEFPAKLIAIGNHLGFKFDQHCVKLPTQILRAVGTHHKKDPANPKEVKLLLDAEPTSYSGFLATLDNFIKENNIPVNALTSHKVYQNVWQKLIEQQGEGWSYTPVYKKRTAMPIIKQCRQIREAGKTSEPIVRSMMSVIRLCHEGAKFVHVLSKIDDRYDAAWTDNKLHQLDLQQGEQGMPASCFEFDRLRPNICSNCIHYNKIKSPIVLGGLPEEEITIVEDSEQPSLPEPTPASRSTLMTLTQPVNHEPESLVKDAISVQSYQLTEDGLTHVYAKANEEGILKEHKVIICRQKLYPIKLAINFNAEGNPEYNHLWRIENVANHAHTDCMLSAEIIHSRQGPVQEMSRYGIVVPNKNNFTKLGDYMRASIQAMMDTVKPSTVNTYFGWQDNGDFVCGNDVVTADGVVHKSLLNEEAKDQSNISKMGPTGEYELWRQTQDVFNVKGQEHAQLAICAAYGGALINFTRIRGMILSLQGVSGAGKSTIQEAAASVWGAPRAQLRAAVGTSKGDSVLSLMRYIGVNNNVPVMLEEVTNMPNEDVSDFIYAMSLGTEKSRLRQRRDNEYSRTVGLNWSTLFVSSSNQTLRNKLSHAKKNFLAESMRVFEITNIGLVRKRNDDADKILKQMEHNFGHGGIVFIRWVQQNKDKIEGFIQDRIDWFNEKLKTSQDERFWVQGMSAILVGAEIAKIAGLHSFDIENLEHYVLEQFEEQRKAVQLNNENEDTIFAEMINDLLGEAVIISAASNLMSKVIDDALIVPRFKVNLRIELGNKKGYISAKRVRDWANSNQLNAKDVIGNGIQQGYLETEKTTKVVLGKSVPGLTGGGQVRCYAFRLPIEELQHLEDKVKYEAATHIKENV